MHTSFQRPHPSLLVNNQERATFNLSISHHHKRNRSTTFLGCMDNLGKQHVWLSEKNSTQIPCLLKWYMEVFHAPNTIIAPLLVVTPAGWLWFWILKAQKNSQKSMFSEENSPLPHVNKLTALPEAPRWIWGSQKHIQWCWLHAVLEWGDTQFFCLQLLRGRVRRSIWHPDWVSSVLVKVLESSSALFYLWHYIGLPFSNGPKTFQGSVQRFTLPTSWQGSSSQPKALGLSTAL